MARPPAVKVKKSLIEALAETRPKSRTAYAAKAQLEHAFFYIVRDEGIRAVEAAVAALRKAGTDLKLSEKGKGRRAWTLQLAGGEREIEVRIGCHPELDFRYASVHYNEKPPEIPVTPKERARHALQEAFYARYNEVAQKTYGPAKVRLGPRDRTALLVGDFEGGVNNGGFETYLSNKGKRTARAAAAALREIGANKTADMLEQAMAPDVTGRQLDALAARFYKGPEDLAALAAVHLRLLPGSAPPR